MLVHGGGHTQDRSARADTVSRGPEPLDAGFEMKWPLGATMTPDFRLALPGGARLSPGFVRFLKLLELPASIRQLKATWQAVNYLQDGADFFAAFLASELPAVIQFRKELFRDRQNPINGLEEAGLRNVKTVLRQLVPLLRSKEPEALSRQEAIGANIPFPATWAATLRWIFNVGIADPGPELRKQFRRSSTLDAIPWDPALAAALKLSDSRVEEVRSRIGGYKAVSAERLALIEAALEAGLYSPFIPNGHPIGWTTHVTVYLIPGFLPPLIYEHNRTKALRTLFPDVPSVRRELLTVGAARVIGIPWPCTIDEAVSSLVIQGLLDPRMAKDFRAPPTHRSPLFEPAAVFGFAERNARCYVRREVRTLDDAERSNTLASILDCGPQLKCIVKTIVQQGIRSWRIPKGHPISRGNGKLTFYLDSEVLTPEQVKANLVSYLRYTTPSLADLHSRRPDIATIGKLIGCGKNVRMIAQFAVESGAVPTKLSEKDPLLQGTRLRFEIDPAVVGFQRAYRNLRRWCRANIKRPEDVPMESRGFKSALVATHGTSLPPRFTDSRSSLFNELVRRGWVADVSGASSQTV